MLDVDPLALAVALMAAAAVAAVAFTVFYPLFSADRKKDKRVQSVSESRAKKVAVRSAAEVAANRKKAVAETLRDLDSKKAKKKLTMRLRLQRAGLDIAPNVYWIASGVCGLAAGIAAFLSMPPSPYAVLAAVAAAFVAAFGIPRWVVAFLIKRRQKKFLAELANAMDVVVRGVKSGLPLNECLAIIARESPEPLSTEFKEVVEQQRVGVTLGEALDRLVDRMPLPEVKFLAIVITIQQQAGGNLSEALGNLAGVMRDRFRLQMKVKALSAEAKASAMVLGSLPPGVIMMLYMSSPGYIMPLWTTKSGNFFILIGLAWMAIGVLVMRKMINFKY